MKVITLLVMTKSNWWWTFLWFFQLTYKLSLLQYAYSFNKAEELSSYVFWLAYCSKGDFRMCWGNWFYFVRIEQWKQIGIRSVEVQSKIFSFSKLESIEDTFQMYMQCCLLTNFILFATIHLFDQAKLRSISFAYCS